MPARTTHATTTRSTTAVEHPNATRMRRASTAFETSDVAALRELWAPDITWTEGGANPLAGTYRGFDDVLAALTGGLGTLDAFAMSLDEVYADDTMGVSLYTMAFTKGGRTAISRAAIAAQIQADKATSVNVVNTNQPGIDAVMGGTVALPEQGAPAEHPNVLRTRQAVETFQAGDLEGLREWWADDIEWTEQGNNRLAGTHRGIDAVVAMLGEVSTIVGPEFTVRLDGVAADEACSVSRFTGYYSKNVIDPFVMVSYLEGGKVTRAHIINANQAAVDAIIG